MAKWSRPQSRRGQGFVPVSRTDRIAPGQGAADDCGIASGGSPEPSPAATAGVAAERGEHWWPVALAIIAVVGLHRPDRPARAWH
jgi:hypothetical protein